MNPKDYLKSLIEGMEMSDSFPIQLSQLKLLLMFMEMSSQKLPAMDRVGEIYE